MLIRRKKKVSGCPQDTRELISSIVHLAERKCVITPLYLLLLLLIVQTKFSEFSDDLHYRYNKYTQLFNDKFMHECHY